MNKYKQFSQVGSRRRKSQARHGRLKRKDTTPKKKMKMVVIAKRTKGEKKRDQRKRLIDKIVELRGWYCFYCDELMRRQDVTIEHLIPKYQNGTDEIQNLYLAHSICNQEAGSKGSKGKKKVRMELTINAGNDDLSKLMSQ